MRGRNRYISQTPAEKIQSESEIILTYLSKTNHCDIKTARRMMVPFDDLPEILRGFADYIKMEKTDLKVHGYTPKQVMSDQKCGPYEAFCKLADLQRGIRD